MTTSPTSPPMVSVVIGVYNGAAVLPATLASVSAQSFGDWECIVVDDGSSDGTAAVARAAAAVDGRFRVVVLSENGGLTAALARGVAEARGRWLARLDGGDGWHPERLARQLAWAEVHPETGLIGCWSADRNVRTGRALVRERPVEDGAIRATLWRACPFVHSGLLARLDLVRACGGYDPAWPYAQDYDLYFRLLERTRGHNLPEVLCFRSTHGAEDLSFRRWKPQLRCSLEIRWKYLRARGGPWSAYAFLVRDLSRLMLPSGAKGWMQGLRGPGRWVE